MKDKDVAVLFHDLLGPASSIRSFIYFILTRKGQSVDQKTKYYLEACLEDCEKLIKKLQELQKNWPKD